MMTLFKRFGGHSIALIIVLSAFLIGYGVGRERPAVASGSVNPVVDAQASVVITNTDAPTPALSREVDFRLFWQVWDMIRKRYVRNDVTDVQLFYGAMSGLLRSLNDPHSTFFEPVLAEKFSEELSGSFEGVGMEIGIKKEQLVIVAPLEGTPAERAGLRAGDFIIKIDDTDTFGMTIDDAVSRIKGKRGTAVKLNMFRKGWEEARDFSITRDRIVIQSARFSMKGEFAYIKLSHFNADTTAKFKEAARRALLSGSKGLIVDLRNNPGGFLDVSVDIASEWMNEGVIVTERFREGIPELPHSARARARLHTLKTVVLVNEGSASASEILAGALQDAGRATIIGAKTFGKGSVQELESLPDGSAVKITVAKWYTPKGRSIDDEGIVPDILIPMSPEDFENDRDPQLDAALRVLRGEKVESVVPAAPKGE